MSEANQTSRKRKLPASLNLRPQSAGVTTPPVTAVWTSRSNNNATRNANASAVTSASSSSNADSDPNKRARLSVSDKSPSARSAATLAQPHHSSKLTSDRSSTSSSSAMAVLQFTSGLPNPNLLFPLAAPITSRPLPLPFIELPARSIFPLLSLPSDILTEITAFLWIWDAFFLRCTCQSLRVVSGLSGGVTGRPVVKHSQQQTEKKLNFPSDVASTLSRRASSLVDKNGTSAVAPDPSSPLPLSRWSSSSTAYPPLSMTQSIDSASEGSIDRTPSNPLIRSAATTAPLSKSTSIAAAAVAVSDDPVDYDEHRFWHNWNSLDLRTILLGWKEFEARRAHLVKSITSMQVSADVQIITASPRDSPPATSTIIIFDSDDDAEGRGDADARSDVGEPDDEDDEQMDDLSPGNIQMKGDHRNTIERRRSIFASGSAHGAASSSSAKTSAMVLSTPSIYDKLQHVVYNFLQGTPRLKTSAPFTSTSISTLRGIEDIASSSEEDLWLMNFLQSYRFPNISHLHFGYLTLHSSLLQHLQVFCCQVESESSSSAIVAAPSGGLDDDPPPAVASSSSSSTRSRGIVTEVSVQHSEKSVGKWLNTTIRGMGRLTVLHLDGTHASKPLWATLAPLMPSLSQLTRLHLIGPTTLTTALPSTILDFLSSSLPLLIDCTIEHGWMVNQSALVSSAAKIKQEKRWMFLQKIKLVDFRQVEHIFPLLQAFHERVSLKEITIQLCVNLRLPIVEIPSKKIEMTSSSASSTTTNAKKQLKRATTPPRKRAASPQPPSAPAIVVSPHTGELTVQMSAMPCVPNVTCCDFSACSSLTVPSFHAISVAFPRLQVLHLNGYDSKTIGGSALKLLFDPTLFPSLCELHLMNAIHLNDHALEALPKKTRMNHLDTLNITIDTNLLSNTVAWMQSAHTTTAGSGTTNGKSGGTQIQRLTEHGLRMLCTYCPALTSLSLAGHSHLSVPAMLRMPSHLLYLQDYNVCGNKFVDASFLHGILHNNVRHALTLHVSLTNALMRTASTFLQHSYSSLQPEARNSAAAATATRSSTGSHVAISSSPSSAPSINRTRLAQMLSERMNLLSKNRITLVVQA